MLYLMQPSWPLACFAAREHCWCMFKLVSTRGINIAKTFVYFYIKLKWICSHHELFNLWWVWRQCQQWDPSINSLSSSSFNYVISFLNLTLAWGELNHFTKLSFQSNHSYFKTQLQSGEKKCLITYFSALQNSNRPLLITTASSQTPLRFMIIILRWTKSMITGKCL